MTDNAKGQTKTEEKVPKKRRKTSKRRVRKARKTALTPKQLKFIAGIAKGLSQREAYKQAYDTSKMTDKTVDKRASELATKNGEIRGRLEKLQKASNDRLNIDVDKARDLLIKNDMAIIKANITDYIEIDKNGLVKVKQLEGIDTTAIRSIRFDKTGAVTGIDLHDKKSAQEDLKKLLGIREKAADTHITVSYVDDSIKKLGE